MGKELHFKKKALRTYDLEFMRAACLVVPKLPRGETCPTRLAVEGPLFAELVKELVVVFPSKEYFVLPICHWWQPSSFSRKLCSLCPFRLEGSPVEKEKC